MNAKDGATVLLTRDPDELQAMVHGLRQMWSECADQRDAARASLATALELLRAGLATNFDGPTEMAIRAFLAATSGTAPSNTG